MKGLVLTEEQLAISHHQIDTNTRVLKVEKIGDFWAKRTKPSIRLQGKWMLQAGLLPNRHVQITNPSPGVLLIQLLYDITQSELQQTNSNPFKK
jgi:hypothetical protein